MLRLRSHIKHVNPVINLLNDLYEVDSGDGLKRDSQPLRLSPIEKAIGAIYAFFAVLS